MAPRRTAWRRLPHVHPPCPQSAAERPINKGLMTEQGGNRGVLPQARVAAAGRAVRCPGISATALPVCLPASRIVWARSIGQGCPDTLPDRGSKARGTERDKSARASVLTFPLVPPMRDMLAMHDMLSGRGGAWRAWASFSSYCPYLPCLPYATYFPARGEHVAHGKGGWAIVGRPVAAVVAGGGGPGGHRPPYAYAGPHLSVEGGFRRLG